MRKLLLFAIILFMTGSVLSYGQSSIQVLDVNSDNYPVISAEFKGFDPTGKEYRNYNIGTSLTIKENGNDRTIQSINCPENISAFSIIMVIDRSGSMVTSPNGLFVAAKQAATSFVDALPIGRSECCVVTFSHGNPIPSNPPKGNPYLAHEFSDDKKSLKFAINSLGAFGGTDYNKAFLSRDFDLGAPGAIMMAEFAKYKPIIIFLTDGEHDIQVGGKLRTSDIIQGCQDNNITCYTITMGDVGSSTGDLQSISGATDGQSYINIDQNQIEQIYLDILSRADASNYPPPCSVEWITDCDGGNVEMTLNMPDIGAASTTYSYSIADNLKPIIETSHPKEILFLNVDPNGAPDYKDTTVAFTNKNNITKLSGLVASDPRWSVISLNTNPIQPDENFNVTLRYTPDDSLCHQTSGQISGNHCVGGDFTLKAGFVYVNKVAMGNVEVGQFSNKKVITFCNQTCDPIKIENSEIKGNNADEFEFVNGHQVNTTIQPGQCHEIEFKFSPKGVGMRNSTIRITSVNGVVFTNEISGDGIDNSSIVVNDKYSWRNTNCELVSIDTIITVRNDGGVALNVTQLEILTGNDFEFKGGVNPAPFQVNANGGTFDINLTFRPSTMGAKSEVLKITHTAQGSPRNVTLEGFMDTVDVRPSVTNIDLGYVCPDSLKGYMLEIENFGTILSTVNAVGSQNINLLVDKWDINSGSIEEVEFEFSTPDEGVINETIVFTDEKCKNQHTVNITGIVEAPSVNAPAIVITATIGNPKQEIVKITNTSNRTIFLDDLYFSDSQFKVTSAPDKQIDPGETIEVIVSYTPDNSAMPVVDYLILVGKPCDFFTEVEVTGNPDMALATIEIGKNYSALIGGEITMPIILKNKLQFAQSKSAFVATNIEWNPLLLEMIPPYADNISTPDNTTGTYFMELETDATNNDETLGEITFRVLNGLPVKSTDIVISNTASDLNNVVFTENGGRFTVIEASADVSVKKDITAKPGEIFTMDILLNNGVNLSSEVHRNISTEIRFNAALIEPWESTPAGTVYIDWANESATRTIKLENLNVSESSNESTIGQFKFRAMLGNVTSTDIEILNTEVENGFVVFTSDTGKFSLDGVCDDGVTRRLYNPFADGSTEVLSIDPNPSSNKTEIKFRLIEPGNVEIYVFDLMGNRISNIISENLSPGLHTIDFDAGKLVSGSYMLVYKTPTQVFNKSFNVIK